MSCGQMMACLVCLETWNDGTMAVFPDFRRAQTFEGAWGLALDTGEWSTKDVPWQPGLYLLYCTALRCAAPPNLT